MCIRFSHYLAEAADPQEFNLNNAGFVTFTYVATAKVCMYIRSMYMCILCTILQVIFF